MLFVIRIRCPYLLAAYESYEEWRSFQERSPTSQHKRKFTEAPWLHKRNVIYYLSYASGWPESISYATSSSPTGPWTYRGVIMQPTGTSGTNHQAIIEFKGQPYFIYHTGALPTGADYRRSVAIEKFNYNADGTIPTINQTSTGVNGSKQRIIRKSRMRHARL
ncbi:family 43 glycosylhydrolase [Paenibacillus terricola]|uniref:family 43 glycosylhydrolase n=1 Tax=Paenibacillus terricola TaxID=2763503 RepID=UPI001CD09B70|nr:family 43 glycosylhydrolase [Paenibacillus terricola]